jgi:guanylate kinase
MIEMIPKLLVFIGPSGAGKSTIMRELSVMDPKFQLATVYTTRPIRSGEYEKISASEDEIGILMNKNQLVNLNEIHGNKYGPSRLDIERNLSKGMWPMLDWAPDRINQLTELFPDQTVVIFVEPPSEEILVRRLTNRNQPDRISGAVDEYRRFLNGEFQYDFCVQSEEGFPNAAAQAVQEYLGEI